MIGDRPLLKTATCVPDKVTLGRLQLRLSKIPNRHFCSERREVVWDSRSCLRVVGASQIE